MSKLRVVNTRFWDDDYSANLDPIEKLLFLYFLTNTSTEICGIYEIPLKKIAMDTGIDRDMVAKILQRFETDGKVFYQNGWVGVKNFIKHQSLNPKVLLGIKIGLTKAPKEITDRLDIDFDSLSHSNSNLNSNSNSKEKKKDISPPVLKDSFGELQKVKLTKDEHQKLVEKMGEKNVAILVTELDTYMASTGKKYSSHYATILNWARRKVMEHTEKVENKKYKVAF